VSKRDCLIDKRLKKILKRCSRADRKAQEQLYKDFYSYAMSISLRYSSSYETAQEVVNDSFVKVFKSLVNDNLPDNFKPWLRRIIINASIDSVRKELKNNTLPLSDVLYDDIADNDYNTDVDADEVICALQQLTETGRVIFNLYIVEEYSHREIANLLDITESTSRSYLTRSKKKLKDILTKSL